MVQVVLTFGGGINARRRTADVDPNECVSGSVNFDLDPQYRALTRRKAFDLVATATNAASIQGFAQLIKADGTVSTLVQAGNTVYSWDGDQTFTSVGTVAAGAKLRGPREHNFTLDDFVIITDLTKLETVKKWDGTTFTDLAHNLGGDFFAKYCRVYNERAIYANVTSGIATPHVILGSMIGDSEDLSSGTRPSSAVGFDAAWFLPMPDLRPINGLEAAFGAFIISTERGRLFTLAGNDATDFNMQEFHVGSAVVGDEAIKNIGNDVIMGNAGRIESLSGTINFGDVESNDVSATISPLIDKVTGWTIEYDRRGQDVYCFPNNQSAVWVLHKKTLNDPISQGLSPWSKWTTAHASNFTPTAVMQLINPLDMTDAVYFGDALGNIYMMEGDGSLDAGTDTITVIRRSGLIQIPEGNAFDIRGWITYRKQFAQTVTIRILAGGKSVYDQEIQKQIPGAEEEGIGFYNADSYYNDGTSVYNVGFSGKIFKQDWSAAGHTSFFQVEIEITASDPFAIEEVGLNFETAET